MVENWREGEEVVENCMEGEVVLVVRWIEGEVKKWLIGVVVAGNWESKEGEMGVMDKVAMGVFVNEGIEEADRQGRAEEDEDNLGGNV